MTFIKHLTSLSLFCLLLFGCRQEQEIIILHSGDHHGALLPTANNLGGIAERGSFIKEERKNNKNILLLDAGDINSTDILMNHYNAIADIMAYNYMGYDAMSVGDTDINRAITELRAQQEIASFPFISANISFDKKQLFEPYIIKKFKGFKIGVFAITSNSTKKYHPYTRNLNFDNEIETSKKIISILKKEEKVDMIIALSHLGIRSDNRNSVTSLDLAKKVDGIDIIIDAHSNTYLNAPLNLNNTKIVSTKEHGEYIGKFIVKTKGEKIESINWEIIPIKGFKPDKNISKLINPYIEKSKRNLDNAITIALNNFNYNINDNKSSEIGSLVTESMMNFTREINDKPKFSVLNRKLISGTLKRGYVSRRDLFNIINSNKNIVVATIRGYNIKKLFDEIILHSKTKNEFPELSRNIKVTIDSSKNTINSIEIDNIKINYGALYNVVTTTDMIFGNVKYPSMLQREGLFETSSSLCSATIEYIQRQNSISPKINNTIIWTGKKD